MIEFELGVDGYPLDPTQADAFFQRELDSWLARGNPNAFPPALDLRDPVGARAWILPMVHRHAWITANRELLPMAQAWRMHLEHLLTLALNHLRYSVIVPPESLLAIAKIAPGTDLLARNLRDYFGMIKSWTPELRAAVHRLLPSVEVTPHCLNDAPARVAWDLFLDFDDPGDDAPCWSAAIRGELRGMPAPARERWLRLFKVALRVPDGKWQVESGRAIKAIGESAFRAQAEAWLTPLGTAPSTIEFSGCLLLRLLLELTQYPLQPKWANSRSERFWQLLAPQYGVPAAPSAIPSECVDQFPVGEFPAQAELQGAIDAEMRMERNVPSAALKRLQQVKGNLEEALRTRIAWVDNHTPVYDGNPTEQWVRMSGHGAFLRSLQSSLLRSSAVLDEEAIVAALAQGSLAAFERAAAYTKEHGYRPAVVAAVRKLNETLHGTITDQTARKHVGWWLWLDDVTPIDPAECWTGVIRADLRSMPPELRRAWMVVIGNMTFQIGSRIPAKWSKVAGKALAALGADEFHTRMQSWFQTLDDAKPRPLSTPGSDLLRCLLWDYSLLDRRPETDEALRRLTCVKWKNKQARDRALKLTPILAALFPDVELPRRPEPKLPNLPNPQDPAAMFRFMLRFHPEAARIEVSRDVILIRGELDHYQVTYDGWVTGRGGRHVLIDLDRVAGVGIWQSAIDNEDLKQGMFGVNLQRLMLTVSVLAADRQFADALG